MIDPRLLRDEPDRIRAAQAKRGLSDEVVDRAVSADDLSRIRFAFFTANGVVSVAIFAAVVVALAIAR